MAEARVANTPTQEQVEIIAQNEGSSVVVASAGSGKTFVVVERYLRLVQEFGVRPSQILTITFTNKAAAEMKRRIVDRLFEKELFEEAQEAETGPIQTIHSFYEKLLRENSVEAGMDPKFELAGGGESDRLKRDAVRFVINSAEDDDNELIAMFVRATVGRAEYGQIGAYEKLESEAIKILNQMRSSGHEPSYFEDLYQSGEHFLEVTQEELIKHLPEYMRNAIASTIGVPWRDVAYQEAGKIRGEKTKYSWLRTVQDDELTIANLTCGLAQLALYAWAGYERMLSAERMIDFDGLESRAVRLLETSPQVRHRVSDQFLHVIVDESQDLNRNQFRLFDAIDSQSKMLVGDGKQSIYAFRNADVAMFKDRARQGFLKLSRNFRSDKTIINMVDVVFSQAFGADYFLSGTYEDFDEDVTYDAVERIHLTSKSNWHELAEFVALQKASGVNLNSICILIRRHREAEAIEAALKRRGIGVRMNAGQSQFFARSEVRDLVNALLAVSSRHENFAWLATLRSPIVGLSLDAIVLLAKPQQDQELDPEDQQKLDRFMPWFLDLRAQVDHVPASEVLSKIINKSDLFLNLLSLPEGRRRIENVRKLLLLAMDSPELSAREFAELIRNIERLRHDEGDAATTDESEELVTLMTIHKAKGLEWDTVIIADGMDHKSPPIFSPIFDADTGWIGYWLRGKSTYAAEYLRTQKAAKEREELVRLQYVAMTRAKKRLVLTTWGDSSAGMIQLVRTAVGGSGFERLATWHPSESP
ncbi:MAG: UvrD-helicase domain-containing protein [Armatimonadetes bacterium]|nr:UvrD-helicase domain-containing protein [Armatimonadota bacterium]